MVQDHPAMDRRWSWVIAAACCFINCLHYGVIRMSGLLLPATVESFQVTRAEASIPYSISTSVRNLSGIFIGYFGQKFGLRPIISTGCIVAAVAAGLSFFATNITWFSVCWGVFGFGSGLATCFLPLAINQNFSKYRGTASGISYSGSYIGSLAFPTVVVQLIDSYGLQGTILVLSSTLLNGLIASMAFRTPRQGTGGSTRPPQSTREPRPSVTSLEQPGKGTLRRKVLCYLKWMVCGNYRAQQVKGRSPSIYLVSVAGLDGPRKSDTVAVSSLHQLEHRRTSVEPRRNAKNARGTSKATTPWGSWLR